MDHRRWLAGDMLTIADFAAAAHLSCLDYVSDVDWTRNAGRARVVRQDQVAAGVPLDPRRPGAGVHPAAALCGPRLLRWTRRAGGACPAAEGARGWRRASPPAASARRTRSPRRRGGSRPSWRRAGTGGCAGWPSGWAGAGQPAALWPEARSVIMLAEVYTPEEDPLAVLARRDRGAVSVYARGRDYHDLVKKRLKRLGALAGGGDRGGDQGLRRHRAGDGEAAGAGGGDRLAGQAHQPASAASSATGSSSARSSPRWSCRGTRRGRITAGRAGPASTSARPGRCRRPTGSMRGGASAI